MQYTDTTFFDIADTIKDCIQDRIEVFAGLPELKRACVIPGDHVDDECTCGILTVRNPTQFGSITFPSPANDTPNEGVCGLPYVAGTFIASVLRCAPGNDKNGKPPKCEALSDAALLQQRDKFHMRNAVMCCLAEMKRTHIIELYTTGLITEIGPRGGCVGSEMNFSIGLINACPCPA